MKKLLFILLFLISSNVYAEEKTYYTEYGPFSEWSETYIESNELTNVDVETRNLYFKEVVHGDYFIERENPIMFPYVNYDLSYTTEPSEWSNIMPDAKMNREISIQDEYYYQDMKEIRYIYLYDVKGSYGTFQINEIKVFAGHTKINYTATCSSCYPTFIAGISNGLMDDYLNYLYNSSYLEIDLGDYYSASSIRLDLYLYDKADWAKNYSIAFTKEKDMNKRYFSQTYTSYFKSNSLSNVFLKQFDVNDLVIKDPEYYDEVYSEVPVFESKTRKVRQDRMYSYIDRYYFYYDLEKVYSEEYLKEPYDDYTFKEILFYKDYYRYQTRDKLVLKYPLVITSEDQSINDFIVDSSKEVVITADINYKKNDIYTVNFLINNYTIEEQVEVNIPKKPIVKPKEDKIIKEKIVKKIDIPIKQDIKEEKTIKEDKKVLRMFLIPSFILMMSPIGYYFKSRYNN